MIRVILPQHLRELAGTGREIQVEVGTPVTQRRLLDAIEEKFPTLRGTIRDQSSGHRRKLVRFFACEEDLSHESPDALLPADISEGKEPFVIIGAIAGG